MLPRRIPWSVPQPRRSRSRYPIHSAIRAEDHAPEERDWPARVARRAAGITSHMAVHTSGPQTLALALDDSPVGLAAWIVERLRSFFRTPR